MEKKKRYPKVSLFGGAGRIIDEHPPTSPFSLSKDEGLDSNSDEYYNSEIPNTGDNAALAIVVIIFTLMATTSIILSKKTPKDNQQS